MLELLEHLDRGIVLAINSLNTPWLDEFMWLVSGKFTWVPLYVFLIFLSFKKFGWKGAALLIGVLILGILAVDIGSVYLFKEQFLRYRPSHNLEIQNQLHYYQIEPGDFYRGGLYGFVSSHASNFFFMACYLGLIMKNLGGNKWLLPVLLGIAVLVCMSRIYLGVHYPSDVIAGGLWGAGLGWLFYRSFHVFYIKWL